MTLKRFQARGVLRFSSGQLMIFQPERLQEIGRSDGDRGG
jgi:hypothetical protein